MFLRWRGGFSARQISGQINRSCEAILRVIKSGSIRGRNRRRGLCRKLPERAMSMMMRASSTGKYKARELRTLCALMVCVRRVHQLLTEEPNLQWEKAPRAPALTLRHKQERSEWAEEMAKKVNLSGAKSCLAANQGFPLMELRVISTLGRNPT